MSDNRRPAPPSRPHGRGGALPVQTNVGDPKNRIAAGKALRDVCPRTAHARWTARPRRDDPVAILIENSRGRLKNLLPIRYGRMMADPFAFYRGAAALMASDLSTTPSTGLTVQACGDAHLLNFGGFATPERHIVFDLNDFDETAVAPWEWDVKRLVASFTVAGRVKSLRASSCREAAWEAARSYRRHLLGYAGSSVLDTWYDVIDVEEIIKASRDPRERRYYRRAIRIATSETAREREFARFAHHEGRPARIRDHPPLIYHLEGPRHRAFKDVAARALAGYRESLPPERRLLLDRFELVDAAFKVVGVGSVGTFCGIMLMMSGDGEPLFLQFKEARASVLERYAGPSPYPHHGQRVVVGQRLMQAASDIFLGWTSDADGEGRHFYLRQLRDAKVKPVVELMAAADLQGYARLCGRALARAHARSLDTVTMAGYLGLSDAFEDALAKFGDEYARQTERDHETLLAAIKRGLIEATPDA